MARSTLMTAALPCLKMTSPCLCVLWIVWGVTAKTAKNPMTLATMTFWRNASLLILVRGLWSSHSNWMATKTNLNVQEIGCLNLDWHAAVKPMLSPHSCHQEGCAPDSKDPKQFLQLILVHRPSLLRSGQQVWPKVCDGDKGWIETVTEGLYGAEISIEKNDCDVSEELDKEQGKGKFRQEWEQKSPMGKLGPLNHL